MAMSEDELVGVLLRERIRLVAYIRLIVTDAHVADDIFQDVSIQAMQKRATIRDADHLNHWLRRTARHRAVDHLRAAGREPQRLDDATLDRLEARWQGFDALASSDLTEALSRCLAELTERSRRIVQMRYADEVKSGDIAKDLGASVEAVYKTLTRAHQQLAQCVARRMAGEARDA